MSCYYVLKLTEYGSRGMDKRFLAIIGIIVVVFVGFLALNKHGNGPSNSGSSSNSQVTHHYTGNLNSKVTLQEYGDYECPVCEGYFPTVQQVVQKYSGQIRFQFSNLPLLQIHPNAIAGARAAEAADMQGKFWQMHDTLYDGNNWNQWSTSSNPEPYFWQYAAQLGLNVTKFKSDFASSAANDRIQADLGAFTKTGQQEATPTFFLNGKYIDNKQLIDSSTQAPSVDAFSKVIDAALKSTGQGN
jgi:protein-disulfide isomerase